MIRRLVRVAPRWVWAVVLLLGVTAAVALADARAGSQWALFLGRFHPLLVHLPIGGLLIAALIAAASRTRRVDGAQAALCPVLIVSAGGALLAVCAGQLLASSSGYSGSAFFWHRALGYVVAVVTLLAAARTYVDRSAGPSRLSRASEVLIGVAVSMMFVTGHLGGTMTRGAGYLTEHLPPALRAWVPGADAAAGADAPVDPGRVVAYTALVAPVLVDRCVSCHGPDIDSGGLRLDTPDHIRAGGSSGRVVIAGQAAGSELIRRIWLPATHQDAMPPKGRQPITVAEASLLRWWVESGASFEQTLADVEIEDEVMPAIEARVGRLLMGGAAILALDVPPVDAQVLLDLVRRGIPISRLAEDANVLQVQGRGMGKAFGDAGVEVLLPVAQQVTWLDLGGTAVTDAALTTVSRFTNLSRLHLDRTAVTDRGLEGLRGLNQLEYVNLYGTAVSDTGIGTLAELPQLRTVYLWQTSVTEKGIAALRIARPTLRIETGATAH